jgi:hypothetical protein
LVGTPKNAAERSALRYRKANSASRHTHMPGTSSRGINGKDGEPADHDRTECPPDKLGALPLYDEQPDQDYNRERHDGRRKRRRVGLQSFDGAEHRDGRRNRAVTIEQGGADEAHHQQFRAPRSGLRVEQRQQRDDAACDCPRGGSKAPI